MWRQTNRQTDRQTYKQNTHTNKIFFKISSLPGDNGAHFWSQHSGGRGRQISEFEASLVYRASSMTARATQRNLVSNKGVGVGWGWIDG